MSGAFSNPHAAATDASRNSISRGFLSYAERMHALDLNTRMY
jgi:hypothetical protein